MIGLSENVNGLYRLVVHVDFFKLSSFTSFNKNVYISCNNISKPDSIVIPSLALWHFRLGHISHQRLSHMQSLYPSISCNNKDVCDIGHLTKQKMKVRKTQEGGVNCVFFFFS